MTVTYRCDDGHVTSTYTATRTPPRHPDLLGFWGLAGQRQPQLERLEMVQPRQEHRGAEVQN